MLQQAGKMPHHATKTRQRLRERQRWPSAHQVMKPLLANLHVPALPLTQVRSRTRLRGNCHGGLPPSTSHTQQPSLSSTQEHRSACQNHSKPSCSQASPLEKGQTTAVWLQAKLLCCGTNSQEVEKKNIPLNGHVTALLPCPWLARHECTTTVLGTKHYTQ